MRKLRYIPSIFIALFVLLWVGSIIKCEILTLMHLDEFNIPSSIPEGDIYWIGGGGQAKIVEYSNQSAKVYYYYTNDDYFAVAINFTKQDSTWQFGTWKAIWTSGSADDFLWPYIHHSPVGIALLIGFGILMALITIIVWKVISTKHKPKSD